MKIKNEVSYKTTRLLNISKPSAENFDASIGLFLNQHILKGTSPATIAWYKNHISTFTNYLRQQNKDRLPATCDIDRTIIQNYILHLLASENFEIETINGKIRALKALFNYLYDENIVIKNPALKIKQLKTNEKIIATFTPEEIHLLLKQPDLTKFSGLRDYVIILCLLDTGSRINELLKTHISHVEYENYIPVAIHLTATKSRKARILPLSPATGKALSLYITERNKHFSSLYLFLSIYGNGLGKRTFQDKLKIYGKNAEIKNVRVSPHTFRHTFAKMWLMADGDPRTLQEILGHSSFTTTEIYTKLFSKDIQQKHTKFSPVSTLRI